MFEIVDLEDEPEETPSIPLRQPNRSSYDEQIAHGAKNHRSSNADVVHSGNLAPTDRSAPVLAKIPLPALAEGLTSVPTKGLFLLQHRLTFHRG